MTQQSGLTEEQVRARVRERLVSGDITQEQAAQVLQAWRAQQGGESTPRPEPQQAMQPAQPQRAQQQSEQPGRFRQMYDVANRGAAEFNRQLLGTGEAALSIGTGMIAEPVAGLAGIAGSVLPGPEGQGARFVEGTREAMTYSPRSQPGQQAMDDFGRVMGPVGQAFESAEQFTGDIGYRVGGPVGGAAGATIPAAVAEILGIKGTRQAKASALRREVEQQGANNILTPEVIRELERQGFERSVIDNIAAADPGQLDRMARFQRLGIQPTRGDVTQRLEHQKPEAMLLETAQDESGARMRALRAEQSRTITQRLQDEIDATGVNPDVGNTIKQALESRKAMLRSDAQSAYDALSSAQGAVDMPLLMPRFEDIPNIPDAGSIRDIRTMNQGPMQALDELLVEFNMRDNPGIVAKLAEEGVAPQALNLTNFERFRQRLANIERADQTGNMGRVIGPLRNELDNHIADISRVAETSGNPGIAALAKDARQNWQAYKTEFDPKALTEQLIADRPRSTIPVVESSQVYQRLAASSVPIEQVDRVMQSLKSEGALGQRAIRDLQASVVMDLMDSAFKGVSRKIDGEATFSGAAFNRRMDQLDDKIKIIFQDSPQAQRQLQDIRRAAADLTPSGMAIPKGSAGFLMDAFQSMGLIRMLDMIPGAGPMVTEGIREFTARSNNRRAFERALDASPDMKRTINILTTDYPSLGAALGLGYLMEGSEDDTNQNE